MIMLLTLKLCILHKQIVRGVPTFAVKTVSESKVSMDLAFSGMI